MEGENENVCIITMTRHSPKMGHQYERSWGAGQNKVAIPNFSAVLPNFPQNLPYVSANRRVHISARLYPAEADIILL